MQEDEILNEALRTIAVPNTTIFNSLMEKLFAAQPDPHLDLSFDSPAVHQPSFFLTKVSLLLWNVLRLWLWLSIHRTLCLCHLY